MINATLSHHFSLPPFLPASVMLLKEGSVDKAMEAVPMLHDTTHAYIKTMSLRTLSESGDCRTPRPRPRPLARLNPPSPFSPPPPPPLSPFMQSSRRTSRASRAPGRTRPSGPASRTRTWTS